jgi:hypothetical protein
MVCVWGKFEIEERGMNLKVKLALAASLALAGAGSLAGTASAMPMTGLDKSLAVSQDAAKSIDNVAWICRPWGCHWAPGWGYGYGYGWHHYGWHRWGWHHWHHW